MLPHFREAIIAKICGNAEGEQSYHQDKQTAESSSLRRAVRCPYGCHVSWLRAGFAATALAIMHSIELQNYWPLIISRS